MLLEDKLKRVEFRVDQARQQLGPMGKNEVGINTFVFELHDFYESELILNATDDVVSLTATDKAGPTGDPYKEALKVIRRFENYRKNIAAIELDHPLTAMVLTVFKGIGVYAVGGRTDAEQDARIAEVLAGTKVASLTSV